MAQDFVERGFPVSKVLTNCKISPSQFYYQPKNTTRSGRKYSESTFCVDGYYVSNLIVIHHIEELLKKEFVDYGYIKVTHWLRTRKRYLINPKKVYRLMKEKGLLLPKRFAIRNRKQWVNELVPQTVIPFERLEFDIKYVYVHGERKNAMMLTVIDVLTRYAMACCIQYSIKGEDVASLFEYISEHYQLPKTVCVRSDNGSQFTSRLVQEKLAQLSIIQEFALPATPQQNAHIEAYHSVFERAVCRGYEFENLREAQDTTFRFIDFYNNERLHSALNNEPPMKRLKELGLELGERGKFQKENDLAKRAWPHPQAESPSFAAKFKTKV